MGKRILIVEAGSEYHKRHLIEATKQLPYEFYLLQTRFFEGSNKWVENWFHQDSIIQVDSMQEEDIYKAVLEYSNDHKIVFDGVVTFWEGFVPITQYLQTKLKLPPICRGNIRALRHKGMMRNCVSNSLMRQPKYQVLKKSEKINDVLQERNYPLIVKPAEMAASLAVTKVCNDDELHAAISSARTIDYPGYVVSYREGFQLSDDVLVEEYINCDYEISVEGVVYHGQLNIVAVCQKISQPEPYYWEYGHITPPPDMNASRLRSLEEELKSVIESLWLNNCSIHAEIRIRDGVFYFMELGARIGGDLIPEIVTFSNGRNLFSFAASLSVDELPDMSNIKATRYAGEYRFNTTHSSLHDGISSLLARKEKIERLKGVMCVKVKNEIENTIFGDMLAVAKSGDELVKCFEKAVQVLSK